ncbi:MAG: BREX system P-loop protein BrxC, partial [Leptotrichia sp.]|nr:BREX system P-loop protein BrxC [Leptotrichia sp.]
ISLTSTDVSEVIKKRILEKNEYAEKELSLVYAEKESVIKNLVIFDDGIEKKIYSDVKDFQEVYPFIPYQFKILSHVLTSIREHSSSGKHLSEGERSMLAMFKEGAEKYKEDETGVLVSFDKFYDGLQSFLDHSHSVIITGAMKNSYINPENRENCFNVNVLKVLFMIKYVKEIKGTLENITTLMVEDINEDRIVLKEKVKEALEVLIKQTLVQKSGDVYIFLTNEEQEVEKMIDKIDVDMNEILRKISEKIFDKFYSEKKYQSPKFKDYNFYFNQKVDDNTRGKDTYDIGINIVTPNSDYSGNESSLLMKSTQENSVFIDLGENSFYINEIEMDIKILKIRRG